MTAENWTGVNPVPSVVTTQFNAATDKSWAKVTSPDGTIYKQLFATTILAERVAHGVEDLSQ